jgi:hypothetical protein
MCEAVGALCPTIGKVWQTEDRAAPSYPSGVGPDAFNLSRNKRRLFGELEPHAHDVLDMLGSKVQIVLGLMQLLGEFLQLTPQITLEFEHPSHRLSLSLSTSGIKTSAAAEHRFFNLARYHWTDFAQVLPDGFYLERCTHQEFQVSFKIANFTCGMRSIEAAADKMVDVNLIGFLSMSIHAAIALLHSVRVPGDLEMYQFGAVVLQVDAFRGGIGGEQDANKPIPLDWLERLP